MFILTAKLALSTLLTVHSPDVRREVWRIAFPALMEMVLLALLQVVNMLLVSRLGPAAITTVGLANQPLFLAVAIVFAVDVGATAMIARAVGGGHAVRAEKILSHAMFVGGALGLFLSVLAYVSARSVALFMGAQGPVVEMATGYIRIVAPSLLLFSVAATGISSLRAMGDTKSALLITGLANGLVVVFGLPLIYGFLGLPKLGVYGAAWGLFLARVVMLLATVWILRRPGRTVRLRWGNPFRPGSSFEFHPKILKEMLRIGLPSALERLLLQGGLVVFVRAVAGMGTATYAAHQIAANILNLSIQPAQGFAVAATTLCGQALGRARPIEAERSIRQAQRFGLLFAAAMGLLFILAGEPIVRLYTDDADVIAQARLALIVVGLIQPFQATQFIQSGALRGAGETRLPLLSTAVGIWLVRNVVIFLTVTQLHLGLVGAWIGVAVDQLVRFAIIRALFGRGHWKRGRTRGL